jgi:glycerol-3-phosphate acyltransferase PlsX
LTQESAKLCRRLDLNFLGYVEGHDVFAGHVDVVVTDGFVGIIVLKSAESLAKAMGQTLKRGLMAGPVRKLGALLARGALRELKQKMDPDGYGGAPLLGLNGTVIKAHGSARELAIMNAIRVAGETIQHRMTETMARELARAADQMGISKNAVHATAGAEA